MRLKIYFKNGTVVEINIPEENKVDMLVVHFDEVRNLMHFKQEKIKGNGYCTRMTAVTNEVLFIDYETENETEKGKMLPLKVNGKKRRINKND